MEDRTWSADADGATPNTAPGNRPPAAEDVETLTGADQLVEILDGYLAELKSGQAPHREDLIARYPDLADQLDACLAGLEFIHAAESAESSTPRQLGDFRLLREVGRGGMGAVFEAEQVSLHRRAAVKVLRFGPVSDPAAVDRFRREAETIAHLHHTNIVPIFFVGSENGVNYYAMEFIDGGSLAEVLAERNTPLDPLTVVQWGLQAAEALDHAHQRGVIHRDIKPSNLLLDKEGRIWLTDFGLAKRLDDVTLSMTGALLGTPRYMSPEQASAAGRRLDHRTDIYSLGATLYELVTGRPVFLADTPHQVIDQILHQDPAPPRQVVPGLPRDVETILLKCLDKDPEQRYRSARDLADDLRAILDGRSIKARRATWVEQGVKWARRNRRSLSLSAGTIAGTVALVLLAVLSAGWWGERQLVDVSLATDQPPLAAEFHDAGRQLVARQTVPTQEALRIPAGEYQLRVSGARRLSETYQVRLERAQSPKFDFNLDGSLVMAPLRFERTCQVVETDGGAYGLVLDDQGLRCWDLRSGSLRWTMSLRTAEQPGLADQPGWIWPWNRLLSSSPYYGWGPFDLRPWVHSPAADLDGDQVADLVLAARHQACLLAVSGQDGRLLWVAGRGHDLQQAISNETARWQQGVVSGVVAAPTPVGDIDRDGVVDFVTLLADLQATADGMQRWMEAISGATGRTIWRHDFQDSWFHTPAGLDVPECFRWFTGSGAATSRIGGHTQSLVGHVLRRGPSRMERTGYFHHMPSRPVLAAWQRDDPQTGRLTLLAGSHVLAFDAHTGQPLGAPLDCGCQPAAQPVVADVDGDGADELVVMHPVTPPNGPSSIGGRSLVRLGVLSLADRKLLWTLDLHADWPHTDWPVFPLAPPRWPVVADLEQDGHVELMVPDGTSRAGANMQDAWGDLAVLEGATGRTRWRKRLKTMDQQVDHFLAGPDVNGDGVGEVFAVTLWSSGFDVYVDALSGRDGQALWVGRQTLPRTDRSVSYQLTKPLWWQAGGDGWPQLVVPAYPDRERADEPLVCAFSAGTGDVTCIGSELIEFAAADVDGDGVQDLLGFQHDEPNALDSGGTLVGFRGRTREVWKSIGQRWSATADLNGDGIRDLVRTWPDASVLAASGRDGQLLWKTQLPEKHLHRLGVVAATARRDGFLGPAAVVDEWLVQANGNENGGPGLPAGDFDRDGTVDLLVYASNVGRDRPTAPVYAVSGRTGRKLWTCDLQAVYLSGIHALDTRDLDGDGWAEVIWVGASDWEYPDSREFNIHQQQLQLAVISARDGSLLWHQPLSRRYGLTPQTNTTPVEFGQGAIALTYGDLDADGVLDIVVPAEAGSEHAQDGHEMRAFNGQSGQLMWRCDLPPARENGREFSDTPPPLIEHLDGDRYPEVVLLSFEPDQQPGRSVARVRALEGRGGQQRWACQWEVSNACGRFLGDEGSMACRPRPLAVRSADGPPLICLNFWGSPERVVILDAAGQTVSDYQLRTHGGYRNGRFRVWTCDTDADGNDEILLTNADQLMAARPRSLEQPLWQRPATGLWGDVIEGILPADQNQGPRVVVRRADPPSAIFALDAATGETVWSLPCPTPRWEGQPVWLQAEDLALLCDGSGDQPPWWFFQHQFVSRVQEAAWGPTGHDRAGGSTAGVTPGTRVAARLAGRSDDPRRCRPLPWSSPELRFSALAAAGAWAAFYGACLVYLPGVYLIRSVRRRHWSLKWFLLLPAVVVPPLMAVLIDAPELPRPDIMTKLLLAAFTLPVLLAVVRLSAWAYQRRWRPVTAWLVATVVISGALAALVLTVAQSVEQVALQPGERYAWDHWWFICLYGGYLTACLLVAVVAITAGVRRIAEWLHQRSTIPQAATNC
jgi:outer membrane protein assembly factor BamB/predicted Ser/Thr protein kinase